MSLRLNVGLCRGCTTGVASSLTCNFKWYPFSFPTPWKTFFKFFHNVAAYHISGSSYSENPELSCCLSAQQRLSFPFNHYKFSFTDTFAQDYCCLKTTDNFQRLTTPISIQLPIAFLGFTFDFWDFSSSQVLLSITLVLAPKSISTSTDTPPSWTVIIPPMFPLSTVTAYSSLSLSAPDVLSQIEFTPYNLLPLFSHTLGWEVFLAWYVFGLTNCGKMPYFMALLTFRVSRWATSITTEMTFSVTPVTPAFPSMTLVLVSGFLMIDAIHLLFFATHCFQLNIYDLKWTSNFLEFRWC